ncbi:Vmc-like lipoprotein signal peptide domain-containing protein [Mycoplasma capricolum]|uniref:Vmc-like lipoprotein signal peptide domain-containing protein n=1 Tax=Mycoplasma capricolum TaxID=2095 RepID=UPI003DA4480F
MKKLLTLLGSIAMTASIATTAVACNNKMHGTGSNNDLESISSENPTSDNDGLQGDDPNSSRQPGGTSGTSEQPNDGSVSALKSDLDDDSAHTLNL